MTGFHKILAIAVSVMALCLTSQEVRAQQVAIKTNALMVAALTPNFSCEVVTGEHTSVDFSVFGHYKPYGFNSTLVGLQPEFRFWFNGRPLIREYIGATALLTTYNITTKQKVFDGDAVGLGITGGYAFSLGQRWNLELVGGFGFLLFQQKQYHKNDNYDDYFVDEAVKANAWGYKLFPMKLGVSFTYIIK